MAETTPEPVPSLRWVTLDVDPFVTYGGDLVDPQTMELTEKGEQLPIRVAKRLLHLIEEEFDSGSCEANACGWDYKRGEARPSTVGLYLTGDADQHMGWAFTTFVEIGSRVLAVCEECSPDTLYNFDIDEDRR